MNPYLCQNASQRLAPLGFMELRLEQTPTGNPSAKSPKRHEFYGESATTSFS